MRSLPIAFDIRIGIATGEALVGSVGSELMMNYTVMGDTVNLASRLEGANKVYGGRVLVSAATVEGAGELIETREIDRVVLLGQTQPQAVFEIMARRGGFDLGASRAADPLHRGARGLPRTMLRRRAARLRLRARSRAQRRTVDDLHQAHR